MAQRKPITNGRKTTVQTNKRGATSVDTLIGQRVRTRRMEMHMSQNELGDKLGVSFQQIQKYEKGVNRLGAGRLQQVADALDTNMAYFMGDLGNGKVSKPSKVTAFLATKDGLDSIEALMPLEKAHLRGIIALARTLAS